MALLIGIPAYSKEPDEAWLPVDRALAEDAMKICRDEESRALTSAWIWGLSGTALAAYAIRALSGGRGSDSGMKYFAAIGGLGSFGGCWNSLDRRSRMRGLRTAMADDLAVSGATPEFSLDTFRKVGSEFRVMHAYLIAASAGSIRAGCIMPVLLSGMGVFGLSLGGNAGADLAGVSMVGAVGIGGPSMLYYLNIKRDLDRMDALMPRWNESFREKKKEGM